MSVIVLKVSAAARMGLVGYNLCVCLWTIKHPVPRRGRNAKNSAHQPAYLLKSDPDNKQYRL